MNVTDVRIRPYDDQHLKAFASFTVDGWLSVRGVKLMHGAKGFFLTMPSRLRAEHSPEDIVCPVDGASRAALLALILKAYATSHLAAIVRAQAAAAEGGFPLDPTKGVTSGERPSDHDHTEL